ncbi:hypothetical protein ACFW3C_27405, partial [Streptomyces sp. NPDC058871]
MVDTVDIDLFLGLDLGKEFHHPHDLTGQGKTVHDRRLPNTEPKLRELLEKPGPQPASPPDTRSTGNVPLRETFPRTRTNPHKPTPHRLTKQIGAPP